MTVVVDGLTAGELNKEIGQVLLAPAGVRIIMFRGCLKIRFLVIPAVLSRNPPQRKTWIPA